MKRSKFVFLLLAVVVVLFPMVCNAEDYVDATQKLPSHPRLLLLRGAEKKLMKNVKKDSIWFQVHQSILNEADKYVKNPNETLSRQMKGKRLLSVSRSALKKIFYLSYAFRTTKNKAYMRCAADEMMNVAAFSDWNPSHFLDVAEMTLAVSIGYDWLYDKLTPHERSVLRQAIIEKGLKPSLVKQYNNFVTRDNNWSQVCHAGMVYGALAVWEEERELSAMMVNRAIENLPISMGVYGPDGVYPEGCVYWTYGTTFNVLLLDELDQMFHTDFGLSEIPGFMKTGLYVTHLCEPTMTYYAYSDNGNNVGIEPAAFWFYQKTHETSILFNQMRIIKSKSPAVLSSDRLAPAAIIWGCSSQMEIPKTEPSLSYSGDGPNPVYVTRSGWGENDAFLGMKCGSPYTNHAHMDEGSFVYVSQGVQWATDLGGESYNELEQNGLGIWNRNQKSDRWSIYRYSNFNHNTLTFNGQLQKANGNVIFSERNVAYPGSAAADLTPAYEGQVKKILRRCSLNGIDNVKIEDHIETNDQATVLTWTMMTAADAVVMADGVKLTKNGHTLYLRLQGKIDGNWTVEPATPSRPYENQNKGFSRICFTTKLSPLSSTDIVMSLNK